MRTNPGITSYGSYIPRYRMNRQVIWHAMGWLNSGTLPGEKAVANHDEDSLTMAVNAAMDCLASCDRKKIEGLYFATTTSPYHEGEGAAIMATALDFRPNIRTADFSNSIKGGTSALLAAYEAIKAGDVRSHLVCASDCRLGKPGGFLELVFGDGAAALLLGNEGVIAGLECSYSLSYNFPDYRRTESDSFVRSLEDRFIREEGYGKFIPEAISGLLKKYGMRTEDFAKVAYPCLNLKEHVAIQKRLGFQPGQVQAPLLTTIGEAGVASPLLYLVAMLEEARPGDKILLASYGNGAEALAFSVTSEIERIRDKRGVKKYLGVGKELASYEKYLVFRGILPVETGGGEDTAPTELPLLWRERKVILGLYGSKCTRCGTPFYPPQKICANPDCGAVNEMEDYPFSDKRGTLFSYARDQITCSISGPQSYGLIDFEGGGRFLFELIDCDPDSLKIGMPVQMNFRRKFSDKLRGIHGYFWKAVPAGR
jgi:hydroxymethylglutaryl-CoA synthase